MTDNSDLLGGDAAPEAPKRKRGRPAKPVVTTETPKFDEVAAPVGNVTAQTADVLADLLNLVPAGTDTASDPPATAKTDAPSAPAAESEDSQSGAAGLVSEQNTDGSVSVVLPPISPEYARALANRVTVIGQPKREYAYQRLLRAGKKL